jgi:2-polyprenyl-6-methoxyphenol hydroxylase-like FAD-dependent oxidoreductase
MRFVVAGGGVAGLSAGLVLARAGHEAVVLERDDVTPDVPAEQSFAADRKGIPHFFQPHAFLPRGRQVLRELAPDVIDDLMEAGAEPQDLTEALHGPRRPGDEDLVYLWVRRPLIEWALRRAAAAHPDVDLRSGVEIAELVQDGGRATGVLTASGETVPADVVVDALGRYRSPAGWRRAEPRTSETGAIYYCRYFRLADGVDHHPAPLLNPRGDLGYMAFNTFRGDNRTFAVILLVPAADRELRVLRNDAAWMAAAAAIRPLDVMTHPDRASAITPVMPMGGLMNVDRTGDPGVRRLAAVGDAFCHTDPAFAYGLSFSLVHAQALARAAQEMPDDVAPRFRAEATPEARERYDLACEIDRARARRWAGESVDIGRRDGCYPLFSFAAALAAAPHDDEVLRRTIRRVGLLDRTAAFDGDADLHERIETIFARLTDPPPPPAGPPRDEMLALVGVAG